MSATPVSAVATATTSPDSAPKAAVLPVLLEIVADKTGYPADTLNPDMDLEGDLGIDSIKRVEILSAVREKLPGAPQVKPEHLGTLRTLRSIADYLSKGSAQPAAASVPPATVTFVPDPIVTPAGRIVRSVPVLAPVGPRDIFPLKGVVIAVSKDSGLDQALAAELKGKGLDASVVSLDAPQDLPAQLGALVIVAPARPAAAGCPWTAESEAWLKKAFLLAQAAGKRFAENKTRGLLATVTRLDGGFGLLGGAEQDPAFGGLSGLVKTAAREWPEVVCRALDLSPTMPMASAAAVLAKELGYEGPLETAISESGVKTVVLEERPVDAAVSVPLSQGDVVLVTGGARGVTAECALALAEAFKPTLVLLGRSPLPAAEDAYPQAKTESELRSALAKAEKGATPKSIGEKAKALLAAREIRATLARLKDAGCQARYEACDARDAAAVKALCAKVKAELGPVRGLVHGAGVLADKAFIEKTPAMLDSVLDAKLAGLRHFLDALDAAPLKVLALFSSSTARYGRVGQSDYAVANEALNKAADLLARRLPGCRVASLGWGPWDGGMVDKNLKALFEAEGVGVIGLKEGGAHLVAELSGRGPAETVVVAELPGKSAALPVVFERSLTLEDAPVLKDHAFAGRAVLPFALSAEWLAHAALHANPGLSFVGFDDLRVLKGVFVLPGKSTPVSVHAGPAKRDGETLVVPCEIRGRAGVHVSARVLLSSRRSKAPAPSLKAAVSVYKGGVKRAYEDVLFHGDALRVIKAVSGLGPDGFAVESAAAPAPSAWTARPPRDRWLSDPAVLDSAFQAMILWSAEHAGAPCLPSFVARYRQYVDRFPETGARVVASASRKGDGAASADIEFLDERGNLLARIEGHESTLDASLVPAFRRNAVEAA